MLIEEHAARLGMVCRILDLPRTSYYYQAQAKQEDDLKDAVQSLAGQFPTYGTHRITHQLQRALYRYVIGRERIQRLMHSPGLLRPIRRVKVRTANSEHVFPRFRNLMKNLVVSHLDQVWVADITYIRLKQTFIYLAVLMCVFTRSVRGWRLNRTLDQSLTLNALVPALVHRYSVVHHSDQGIHPEENRYAERLMCTIK